MSATSIDVFRYIRPLAVVEPFPAKVAIPPVVRRTDYPMPATVSVAALTAAYEGWYAHKNLQPDYFDHEDPGLRRDARLKAMSEPGPWWSWIDFEKTPDTVGTSFVCPMFGQEAKRSYSGWRVSIPAGWAKKMKRLGVDPTGHHVFDDLPGEWAGDLLAALVNDGDDIAFLRLVGNGRAEWVSAQKKVGELKWVGDVDSGHLEWREAEIKPFHPEQVPVCDLDVNPVLM